MDLRITNAVIGTYELEDHINDYVYQKFFDTYRGYIDTSISYNNDWALGPVLKYSNIKVISKIPPQMTDDYEFMVSNHLRCLGRKKIDIMLIHNPRSDWHKLATLMEKDKRFLEVGVSNFSIDELEDYKNLIGHYPLYNEMEINPNYYDKDLIEFCHDKGIKIIAYAIFGGKYNARTNITKYTQPYLIAFAAKQAELVIVRSDNPYRLMNMLRFIKTISSGGLKCSDELFNLEKSTDKSIVPMNYSYPKYYTKMNYPTNSSICKLPSNSTSITDGFTYSGNVTDVLQFSKLPLPKYEFVSDYRAYFRYKLDEYVKSTHGKYPRGTYLYPSTYVCIVKVGFLNRKSHLYLVSFNLITKDGNLSKIDDDKCKFILETEKLK